MRELEFTALRLQQELMQLHEGLDITSSGRLSSVLIPPNNLSALLQQIALRLPRDVSFITSTDVDSMYVYYGVARVQAYATVGTIRLVVRIPLQGADRIMTLYRVEPLPTFSTLINRPIQIEPETMYFAVTENRQYYALLKEADIQNCEQGLLTICEANFPLIHKRVPSCMSALYFGQSKVAYTFCRKFILQENFKPVWIYANNKNAFWVYSLPAPTRVTKTCKVNGTTRSKDMMLAGAGILQEDTNCQYFSEAFILLPVTDSYINFTLTVGHIVAPDLPQLVSPEENHQLEEYSEEANSTLRALESMMRRDTATNQQNYVELSHLIHTIKQRRSTQNTNRWIATSISLVLIIMIVCFTLKYWRRLSRTTCAKLLPWRNGNNSSASRPRKTPKPRLREHHPLPPTQAEATSEINETEIPLNLIAYSDATPLQVDPSRLATSDVLRPARENEDRIFSRPGIVPLPSIR
jgi:hypothetical protein